MKRTFVEYGMHCNYVKTIDIEIGSFTMEYIDKEIGCPFGVPMKTMVREMGYKDVNDCIKKLKHRGLLPKEIDYKEQKENERVGLLKLGVLRIKHWIKEDKAVNCNRISDICEKLISYGMNYVDAQEQILGMYENEM